MKKLLLLSLMVLMAVTAMARPVDPDRAVVVAKHFMAQYVKGADQYTAEVVYTHRMPKSGHAAMYVVNLGFSPKLGEGDPQGGGVCFVIVAADDVAHPVLGYSLSRSWPSSSPKLGEGDRPNGVVEESVLPPQVSGYLDDLAAQIESAAGSDSDTETVAEWRQLLTTNLSSLTTNLPDSVGPLLTTTWDQGQYYNALCPEDANGPDGHVYTGCVATAMAQIINYWGYPMHGRGTHSYETNYGTLSVNYDSANYDYANMPTALTAASTPAQVNAVATLMRDCGVAANMGYGPNESGAYDIDARAGLINFFRISPDASYAEKAYFNDTDWNNLLQSNIANNQPVLYSGYGDNGGHTFVCDGYKTNDYFHFNFGWGGYADGWYLTDAVNPAGNNYSYSQTAIVGIVPDSVGDVILGQMAGNSTFTIDKPLEFYHLMGHNAYDVSTLRIYSSNIVTFVSNDEASSVVIDFVEFLYDNAYPNLSIYEGSSTNNLLRHLSSDNPLDMSPVVSSTNAVTAGYSSLLYAGDKYKIIVSKNNNCRMVSNVITSVDSNTVVLTWRENGNATNWEVEYGESGFALGEGNTETSNDTTITILNLGNNTEYDFYIRPQCGGIRFGPVTAKTSEPNWLNAVHAQPSGYIVDDNNTVIISSAEGLAWLAKQVNQTGGSYNVKIVSDINLDGRLWIPINDFYGNIDGCGHVIYNFHIDEMWAGLIKNMANGSINNLGIESYQAKTSGLVGSVFSCTIKNCYAKNGLLVTDETPAGLIGSAYGSLIENCYSNNITSTSKWGGSGLIWALWGRAGGVVPGTEASAVKNCYSELSFDNPLGLSVGVVAHYIDMGIVSNCYALNHDVIGGVAGSLYVSDTTRVLGVANGLGLRDTIQIDTTICTDLLTALNAEVISLGDTTLRTWVLDNNTGRPVFGDYYSSSCNNVTNLSASNNYINNEHVVRLTWEGTASMYEIKCIAVDTCQPKVFYKVVDGKEAIISELPLGKQYTFYVRSICDSSVKSGWGDGIVHKVDIMYWHEAVNEEPEGYSIDEDGNIWISSSEGFAWCAKNGDFSGKTIHLTNDIDMGLFRWYPIVGRSNNFNGHGHTISNLYCNEERMYLGLFESLYGCKIENITIAGNIYTQGYSGGLVGNAQGNTIRNCHSSVNICIKASTAGSLLGYGFGDSIINCSASGSITGYSMCGGLIGYANEEVVLNCYATGDIIATSNPRDFHMHRGGLVGYLSGENSIIRNSYAAGSVQLTEFRDYDSHGALSGYSSMKSEISHSYGRFDTINNIWVHGFDHGLQNKYHDNTLFNDSGKLVDTVVVNGIMDTIMVNGVVYEYLLDALNAWVDANDTTGVYRHWAADSANTNGGFPVFAYVPCTPATGSDSIVVCDSYTWHGTVFTADTLLVDTLATLDGCDSIVTHHLTINHGSTHTDTVSADESYTWGDSIYTASGIYQRTYTAANSCDSMVALWLTITKTVHDTTYVDIHDTTYIDVHDTTYLQVHDTTYITVHDTTYMTVHDTTYITVHDTTYIDVPYPVHDTMVVHDTTYTDVPYAVYDTTYIDVHDTTYIAVHDTTYVFVHDTTYIDVPYPVHDTTYITLHDTTYVTVHDTTYIDVHDTTYLQVHDTTYITVHDTTYMTVHDTTYITVHDTTYIDVPYAVHDTTVVHDTTYIDVHDTTYIAVHDTTYVFVHDTTYIQVHDTTYIDVPYPVHDTTYINIYVHDTTYVPYPVHDTTYVDVHDTTYVPYPVHDTTYVDVHDTTYVPYPVHDTTYVDVHDTTYVPYPVHDTTYVDVHDTTYVPYPVHDTTYVPYPVHDTTYVDVHDTTYVPYAVHDTTYVDVHDTTFVPYPVYDTLYMTDTLRMTDTIFVHDTIVIYDTITVGVDAVEYINAKIYANHGQIVVEGADGNMVTLYDVSGRQLATKRDDYMPLRLDVPAAGTYMVKIGDYPARRVVVIK